MARGVTDAAAHGADIVPVLDEVGARCRDQRHLRIRVQVVRERQVGLDAEQQARGRQPVVAGLQAADHAAEMAGHGGRRGIPQHRRGGAVAVAGVPADIEAVPVEGRRQVGLHRQLEIGRLHRRAQHQRAERGARDQIFPASLDATHLANVHDPTPITADCRRVVTIEDAAGFEKFDGCCRIARGRRPVQRQAPTDPIIECRRLIASHSQ